MYTDHVINNSYIHSIYVLMYQQYTIELKFILFVLRFPRKIGSSIYVQLVTVALSHVFLAVHATVVPHNVFLSHTPIVRVIKRRERRGTKNKRGNCSIYRYSSFPAAVQSYFLTACAQRTTR